MLEKWRELDEKLHVQEKLTDVFHKIVNSKVTIYVILFCAYFHSVLRFPQGSSITLFRLLIPLSLCIIFKYSVKIFSALIAGSIGLIVLNVLQYVLSRDVFFPEISFSFSNMILFWIHLLSIFVFICLIL